MGPAGREPVCRRTFNGYHRSDGRVGTANYWLFIPTVFCENRNLEVIREALQRKPGLRRDDRYCRLVQRLVDLMPAGRTPALRI